MRKSTIMKMLVWLRRKYPESETEITLYNLFVRAFEEHFRTFDGNSEAHVQYDLIAFEYHGAIPVYVNRFVRRVRTLYLACPAPTPKGEASCEKVL